jgi:hypothetical protein
MFHRKVTDTRRGGSRVNGPLFAAMERSAMGVARCGCGDTDRPRNLQEISVRAKLRSTAALSRRRTRTGCGDGVGAGDGAGGVDGAGAGGGGVGASVRSPWRTKCLNRLDSAASRRRIVDGAACSLSRMNRSHAITALWSTCRSSAGVTIGENAQRRAGRRGGCGRSSGFAARFLPRGWQRAPPWSRAVTSGVNLS